MRYGWEPVTSCSFKPSLTALVLACLRDQWNDQIVQPIMSRFDGFEFLVDYWRHGVGCGSRWYRQSESAWFDSQVGLTLQNSWITESSSLESCISIRAGQLIRFECQLKKYIPPQRVGKCCTCLPEGRRFAIFGGEHGWSCAIDDFPPQFKNSCMITWYNTMWFM